MLLIMQHDSWAKEATKKWMTTGRSIVEKSLLLSFSLVLSAGEVLTRDTLSMNSTDNYILFTKEGAKLVAL